MSRKLTFNVKCESCKDVMKAELNKPTLMQDTYQFVDCVTCESKYRVHAKKPRGGVAANNVKVWLEPIELRKV